ncbi:MAG: DUF692 domain-containing protein [Pseudomonadota bacterium]
MRTTMNMGTLPALGLGIGWRPELALMIERRRDLGFIELLAENHLGLRGVPAAVHRLRERGVTVIPHGVSLSLGSADLPDRARLDALARLCRETQAPLVSEHVAFVRAGGLDSGHLLPVPRTREALDILVRNVRAAQAVLPVPLVLENIASLFTWPGAEMRETDFWNELLERTGALMLLDVENLYAERRNHGLNAVGFLNRIPLDRVAYVHVAGGVTGPDGLYHDTHAHPLPAPVLALLRQVCERHRPPGILLERDDLFPLDSVLNDELDAVATFLADDHVLPAYEPAEWHVAA